MKSLGSIGRAALVLSLALGVLTACSGDSEDGAAGAAGSAAGAAGTAGGGEGGTAGTGQGGTAGTGGSVEPVKVDKIDLLLMIDNSASMADKQEVLASAVPELVERLANPACIDAQGNPVANQPPKPLDPCPSGSTRQSPPVFDLRVGIISSSLGGHGADSCANVPTSSYNPRMEEMAHLVSRTPVSPDQSIPTWQDKGFLYWDPTAKGTPAGDSDLPAFSAKFQNIVRGVGQDGCGFEAPLEAWYRFLVDPKPYAKIVPTDCSTGQPKADGMCRGPNGVDQTVLSQRAAFLRPDSLVVIAMLSDEDDCSVMDGGQNYLALQAYSGSQPFHLPRATSACKTNPASPDCKSCGMVEPDSDPECQKGSLTMDEDSLNLRCIHQKKRFGIDFLYPTQRYANALSKTTLPDGTVNPLFCSAPSADGKSCTAKMRDPSQVILAGIVGVPWQLLANDPKDPSKGYKAASQLPWDAIAGDADTYVEPTDPFMVQSVEPRAGTSSVAGESTAPPTSGVNACSINGHEWSIPYRNDLQYACTFPLVTPKDCSTTYDSCDCSEYEGANNPLCQAPDGTYGKVQYRAKAYPSPRILNVFKKIPSQSVVTSICAPQVTDPTRADYGYRQVITALVERIRPSL